MKTKIKVKSKPRPGGTGCGTRVLRAVAGGMAMALVGLAAQAATLSYNFNNGLQGWTQIGTTTRNAWNSGGNSWGATQAGAIFGYDGDDSTTETYWVRSPVFQLDSSGPLTVHFWGGKSNGTCPANEADVASTISGRGFKGVALREVATGNFVKSLASSSDGGNADFTLTVADLAPYVGNGKTYTLDFLDCDAGGWGWAGMDNVTIPGTLMQATLGPVYQSIARGSSTSVTLSLPPNLNATVSVTVYVTNSNPGAVTVNGSAAAQVPIVFAAGTANSQILSVIGAGLGCAQLTAGGPGLAATTVSVAVLSPSGLIGRWLSGAEDLQDKSGYTPAGTHDGTLSTGFTPVFAQDVPAWATGSSSLDLVSSGGGAILINNTTVTDAGYQPTFDEGTALQLSVVFWAKGLPGGWNPFVSKSGEGSTGWQVRRRAGSPVATFTVRGTGGEDDPYSGSTRINDGEWHHFAATWDGVAGVRKLYVDGKLNNVVPHDGGPMGLAKANYLTLGGRCNEGSSTPGNTLSGLLFDVQVYGKTLSGSAVQSLFSGSTGAIAACAETPVIDLGKTGLVSVSIPAAANATTAVTVYVTNTAPAVISLAGAVGNVVTLSFPAGASTSQAIAVTGLSEGQARVDCGATALTTASATLNVYGPHLVGHWFNGSENYANNSSFTPAGTHDGVAVGTGTLTFTQDTPPSKPGKSATFDGGSGLMIANSSLLDAGYAPTFDDVMGRQFSVAFWAKGLPANWSGFLSKRGEDAMGWQVRRHGTSLFETFTVRGAGAGQDDPQGSIAIDDGKWHHFAAVWDGSTGTRKCYVDGALDSKINLTNDFGPMTLAPNHHLVLGAREQSQEPNPIGFENWFIGSLYDVRLYNYPLSQAEVSNLSFVAAIHVAAAQRSLHAPQSMTVDVVLPAGANQSQQVSVQVRNDTPSLVSLAGAVANVVTLTYPVGGSLTQQVTVTGITDGTAKLTATGGGFVAGVATFKVWSDPGSRMIGRWLSGTTDLAETSGFRPAGTHDGVAVGSSAGSLAWSYDVPSGAEGKQSLDLSAGNVAVMITNTASTDSAYEETFDGQMANKFSITFWAKGIPTGEWNPWVSKRGEGNAGYQVRRVGKDEPVRPTFTLRGTPGNDDPGPSGNVDEYTWHHYAATWDGTAGTRRLYVDGVAVLTVSGDFGPMGLPSTDHLMLGARDNGGVGNFFTGLLFDVRVYSYALAAAEVNVMVNPPVEFSLTLPALVIPNGETAQLLVTLPAGATATGPVTVQLVNNSPGVVSIVGPSTITFPAGTLVQVVSLRTIGAGQINITATATGLGTATLTTVNTVVQPKLIGHWLSGAPDLADTSGFTPAGTHDAVVVGANPEALMFSSDVPAGHSGQSLDLTTNATAGTTVGVVITNSSALDAGYQPTFDEGMSWTFSVALWTKGLPGDWNGFISKRGEGGIGWQVRRHGGDPTETFTIRGSGSHNEDPNGSIAITDGQWHHFAAVWNGVTGTRKCYVDGVLDPSIDLTADFGPMNLAPNHHVGIGTRESGGTGNFEAWFAGKIYDVRIYNYPITAAEVTALAVSTPPTLTIRRGTGNQLRISWPTSFAGYALEQSTGLTGGAGWSSAGLTVTVEGAENVVYAPAAPNAQFFRLKK